MRSADPGALLPLLLLAVLAGCPTSEPSEEPPPEQPIVSISEAQASIERVVDPVILTGVVAPNRLVTVLSEASGRVLTLPVGLGDRVNSGDVLARLDDVVPSARLAQARAQADQASAALDLARAELARIEVLHAQGATTERDYEASTLSVRSADAQHRAALAAVTLAERAVADTTLRAPFGGQVGAVLIEVGAVIAPGTPAFTVVDLDTALISVGISGREVPLVQVGQDVSIRIPSLREATYAGAVRAVAPTSDSRSRTWPVEVRVPNSDGALRAGMIARVEIVVGERDGVVVPDGAVVEGKLGSSVFVVADGVASKRSVELGRVAGGWVELRSGVQAGETVAVLGSQHLSDGSLVRAYAMSGQEPPASP